MYAVFEMYVKTDGFNTFLKWNPLKQVYVINTGPMMSKLSCNRVSHSIRSWKVRESLGELPTQPDSCLGALPLNGSRLVTTGPLHNTISATDFAGL